MWIVTFSAGGSSGSAFQKHQLTPRERESDTPRYAIQRMLGSGRDAAASPRGDRGVRLGKWAAFHVLILDLARVALTEEAP